MSAIHLSRFGRILLLCLAILGGARAAAAANPQWLADYRALKTAMERNYANLAWYASPSGGADLPRLDRRTEAALRSASTVGEARMAIRDFVGALDDGHFSILPPVSLTDVPAAPEPAQRDLADESADQACAARGYANRSQVAFSLPFESLPGFTLIEPGESASFRTGTLRQGGMTVGIVRIRNFSPSQYPAVCAAAWTAASAAARRDSSAFADLVQERWLAALAASIARLEADRPDALIVDVGSNSGGNDSGDWAARLFTRLPLRSARLMMTAGPLATRYLDEEIASLEAAVRQTSDSGSRAAGMEALATMRARRAAASAPGCAMSWVWTERRPWRPAACARLADVGFASGVVAYLPPGAIGDQAIARHVYWPSLADPRRGPWDSPAYVLTNGATYSSAEMFAAVLQNNRAAKTIGAASGGDGCGFMLDTEPLTLPHVGLQIRMSNCVRLRADGSDEVAGVTPDLPVAPVRGESPRARAARLIATLVADLQRGRESH